MGFHRRINPPLLILLILGFGPVACNSENVKQTPAKASAKAQPINLADGDRKNGLFDVSLEYGNDGIGWLSYSRVEVPKFIETQIARSTDNGKSWVHVLGLADSQEETIMVKGKHQKGVWRDETSCLLYDPADKVNRRWKLYSNRYFTTKPFKPQSRVLDEGTIDVKYASTPAGPWSKAECVVGNNSDCKISMQSAHPDLADVKMNTEPGAIIHNDVIYLSMDAGTVDMGLGEWENYRIILLSSEDHGASWRYLGTLLDHADAMKFGYRVFTGTSLVRDKGKLYIMATPSGALKGSNHEHDGSMVFELKDIKQAQVMRDEGGTPLLHMRLELPGGGSGGLADYDEKNTAGGVMFSTVNIFNFPQLFRIKQTGEGISR